MLAHRRGRGDARGLTAASGRPDGPSPRPGAATGVTTVDDLMVGRGNGTANTSAGPRTAAAAVLAVVVALVMAGCGASVGPQAGGAG